MSSFTRRAAAAAVLAVGAATFTATSASAEQQLIPLSCDGQTLLIRTPSNHADQSWSVGQVVQGGTGHLIPLAFTFTFTPTGGTTLVQSVAKGGGNAGPKDEPVFCSGTFEQPEGTLGISVVAVARP